MAGMLRRVMVLKKTFSQVWVIITFHILIFLMGLIQKGLFSSTKTYKALSTFWKNFNY